MQLGLNVNIIGCTSCRNFCRINEGLGCVCVWGGLPCDERQKPKESQMCLWCSACLAINRDLPFIPNLERRPYLLIRTKRTRRRMQAKPAKPTAMETWEKTSVESESGCSHVIIPSGLPFTFKYAESEQSGSTKTCLSCHLFQVADDSLKTIPIGRL